MERQSISDALKAHRSDLVACGVAHLALFGSRMRGEERAESDLDILIDVDPGHEPVSLIDLAGMCGLIRDITGLEAAPIERQCWRAIPTWRDALRTTSSRCSDGVGQRPGST